MGALHDGHLSLVRKAQQHCDRILVSIFVNPTQFGPGEDFDTYPRDEQADIKALRDIGVDAVYLPSVAEMYGAGFDSGGFQTSIHVQGLTEPMEGRVRSGHFDGVALVVCKLLMQSLPDVAVFGEKDFQQLQVIKRLVLDLDIPTRILAAPLIREPDGVAMSSRNAYLSAAERAIAPWLSRTLEAVSEKLQANPTDIEPALNWGIEELYSRGFTKVDYLELREPTTLMPLRSLERKAGRLLATARLGPVRLLDNLAVRG